MTHPTRRRVGNLGSKTLFAITFALLFGCKEPPLSIEHRWNRTESQVVL